MPRILLVSAPLGLCASVTFPRHRISPPLVHHTSIKIGVTNSYICLTLLKQIWVICDPSAVQFLTHAISGLLVAQLTGIPSATVITQARILSRRLFMRYSQV